jgi:hypothetical protein
MRHYSINFCAFFFACLVCSTLQTSVGLTAVQSAAIVGLLGSLLPVGAVIYSGAFAGMCSPEHLSSLEYILFISMMGTILFVVGRTYLNGFGGKLGTIAFIASVVLVLTKGLQ